VVEARRQSRRERHERRRRSRAASPPECCDGKPGFPSEIRRASRNLPRAVGPSRLPATDAQHWRHCGNQTQFKLRITIPRKLLYSQGGVAKTSPCGFISKVMLALKNLPPTAKLEPASIRSLDKVIQYDILNRITLGRGK